MTTSAQEPTNPVVKITPLTAYPGWQVRTHKDDTLSLFGPDGYMWGGEITFREAVYFAREGEPPFCQGHPDDGEHNGPMGETVYCDGSCLM